MAKIRHIAYRADDVEAMASFFVQGLGMTIVQRRGNGGVDLSDGSINLTILPAGRPKADGQMPKRGIDHLGFAVADQDETCRLLEKAGGRKLDASEVSKSAHYEVKFHGPEGIGIDVGHWVGAAPIDAAEKKGA
jgi:catechol 2,3-dioxygenase-like lactoylglutathione lyase family enzyme